VTVAVVVRNRRERMFRCLEAILDQDYPRYDVLVIDNGSTDGTAEACRERAAAAGVPVRVEVVDGALGHLRNTAARLATGEIVAYTDSDCRPDRRWLATAVRPFEDPGVGVVTGATLPEHPPPYGEWPVTLWITEQTWRFETCNAFYRRAALLASDGFEETAWMWEDTAAGWAVMEGGWKTEFVPEALVYHDVTYPGFWWHVRRARQYGEGAQLLRRYPEMRRELLFARYFQSPHRARVAAAVAGLLLSPLSRKALALTLPYAWVRRPRELTRAHLHGIAQLVVRDLAELEGRVRGSVRARRLLL
jgi:glycosyltransferase involved in cell wall biosynthesis